MENGALETSAILANWKRPIKLRLYSLVNSQALRLSIFLSGPTLTVNVQQNPTIVFTFEKQTMSSSTHFHVNGSFSQP